MPSNRAASVTLDARALPATGWHEDFQAANEYATELAKERGAHKVASFHRLLVEGTGTYALELFQSAPALDTVYVPIGLGAGICGTIAAREGLRLATKIVGEVGKRTGGVLRGWTSPSPR